MGQPTDTLFDIAVWGSALEKYGAVVQLSAALYGVDEQIVCGPMPTTPIVAVFQKHGYEPGAFAECVRKCLAQPSDNRPPVVVTASSGLAVVGVSLLLDGHIVGAAVAGYALVGFCESTTIARLARESGTPFVELWDLARRLPPIPARRLVLHGELLQVLGDTLLRENDLRRESEETALQLSKTGALQNAIFNSANFSSIATDATGVIQIFNVGAERMLGYTAADVMNTITPADISDPQEVIARATALSVELGTPITPGFEALVFKAARGIEDIYELTYIRKDGSRFPAVVSVTALRDDQDAIIGYLLIGTDNTARKQVEEEREKLDQRLRDQQFYTRSLIESNIDALMTTDPRGIITDVNKQAEALTGCTRDELIGTPFNSYFTDSGRAEAGIKRVLNDGTVTNYELIARARDGKETVVSYNATTFHDRDRSLQGVVAAARDVTELKRFEQTLQEKNVELARANDLKDEFLATVSHELRTPLNAVLGWARMLGSKQLPPDRAEHATAAIERSAAALALIINDLLDMSRIVAGTLHLALQPVDLVAVAQAALDVVRPLAVTKDVHLAFSPDLPAIETVSGDAGRLEQVIWNLLANAIKFTPEGGRVAVFIETSKDHIEVRVVDTGQGISPDFLPHVFERFRQADGTTTRRDTGLGLGLAIVRQLVELHGGTVHAASEGVGRGATFTIRLPMSAGEAQGGHAAAAGERRIAASTASPMARGPRLDALRILVVDGSADGRSLTSLVLTQAGASVTAVASAREALEMLKAERPDALVSDIGLPDEDGYGLIRQIRQDEAAHGGFLPAVALTGYARAVDRARILAAGFQAHVPKPVDPVQLTAAITTMTHHLRDIGRCSDGSPVERAPNSDLPVRAKLRRRRKGLERP
ncbi:MAG: hypothetical protein A3H29_13770 [Acidobacteria bacterium RIFCSPLOWO2_02_FULL_67_21]|nr:MAG: hypothetical protein A3H29_13770 [Acidobacteria bacterium RIFCSPLOWO2_02_FULL_67_21]